MKVRSGSLSSKPQRSSHSLIQPSLERHKDMAQRTTDLEANGPVWPDDHLIMAQFEVIR